MFLKTTFALALVSIAGGVLLSSGRAQDQDKLQKDTSVFMKRKLDGARDVVAGLSTEDYGLISKSAQDMMLLSHEAEWNVLTTPEYLKMSNEFRAAAGRLRDSAKTKNLDGATLAYFEVTLNCVRCHKYIRSH